MTKNKAEFFDFGSCKNPALSDNKTGLLVFRGLFYQFIGHLIVHIRLALQCEAVGIGHLSTRIGPAVATCFGIHIRHPVVDLSRDVVVTLALELEDITLLVVVPLEGECTADGMLDRSVEHSIPHQHDLAHIGILPPGRYLICRLAVDKIRVIDAEGTATLLWAVLR